SEFRNDSAVFRSENSSNFRSRIFLFQRAFSTVNCSNAVDGDSPARTLNTLPFVNRVSGESVNTSTVTSPRIPCGLPIRAMRTSHCAKFSDTYFPPSIDNNIHQPMHSD